MRLGLAVAGGDAALADGVAEAGCVAVAYALLVVEAEAAALMERL